MYLRHHVRGGRALAVALFPRLLAGLLAGLLLCPRSAGADAFVGTRALGMGGGLRGAATGDTGPLQNPSGMSLVQSYNIEADYFFARVRSGHTFHTSVVDSTSGYRIAGGFYYTYHFDSPDQPPSGSGHEAGLALSLPFGEYVAIGGTLKYFRLSGFDGATDGSHGGFTVDAGVTVRPTNGLSVGFVGSNLRQLGLASAPRTLGYGAALGLGTDAMLVVDGLSTLDTAATVTGPAPRKGTRLSAGAEVMLAKKLVLRAGGGYDGHTQNGFFTAGLAAVSEAGALDFGLRQDAFRGGAAPRETIFGAGFRLFVPQP
jgi:hypothetical protein